MATDTEHEVNADKLIEDLKTLVRDGGELLKQGAGSLGEKGSEARERLGDALEAAKETIKRFEKKAASGLRSTDEAIREHPYQSIGIALGVGVLLGIFLNRGK
jgi:ElaB/YqjD/DUF883 family membrane-anchored ribosome-binding protein